MLVEEEEKVTLLVPLVEVLEEQPVVRVRVVEQSLVVDFEQSHQWFSKTHSVLFVRRAEVFDTSLKDSHKQPDQRNSSRNE